MKKRFYNLLLVITLIVLFGGIFELASAQTDLPQTLINYPEIQGARRLAFGIPLPELIKYIYLFAVGICGAIALASILLGAIKYIGAAGNSSRISDAKEQIVSAILGVVILLSSYLILYTINPDLVKLGLTLPPIDTSQFNSGTDEYRCICRCKYTVGGATVDRTLYPANLPTNINNWGNNECRLESSYLAWQDCKRVCERTVETYLLNTGCSAERSQNNQSSVSFSFVDSVIESCSQNPSP